MASIELIYDRDCPNVSKARAHLLQAFAEAGLPAQWSEWECSDPTSPDHVRAYGSPTILVDGRDVAGAEASEGIVCCRVYADASGRFDGAPPVQLIASALLAAKERSISGTSAEGVGGWRSSLATFPAVGAALLPVGVCPACWPAYAGLLSSLGVGFLLDKAYLFPLTLVFLAVAVCALGFRAGNRRGYGPFALGLLASGIVMVGKFAFESDSAMYGGIAVLVAASLWNGWPLRKEGQGACPACEVSQERENADTLTKEVAI